MSALWLATQTAVRWLHRITGRNASYRRRLAERVLRRIGFSKSRAVGLARHIR